MSLSVIDEYLATVSPKQKAELERIRKIVKQTVPEAEETISYGIPAFKYKKQPLVYFAAFKDHMSLFPTSGAIKDLGPKLKGYTLSKGTIQFTLQKTLPEDLIKEILNNRLADIAKPKS